MGSFAEKIINDDFLWQVIVDHLPAKRKVSSKNFININCPVCASRGESADRRQRCGIRNNHPGVGIHCFNCGFRSKWEPGQLVSRQMREFLCELGVPSDEVMRINHKALRYRDMISSSEKAIELLPASAIPSFPQKPSPHGAKTFDAWADEGCENVDFLEVADYVFSRGDEIARNTFYWTPSKERGLNRRVIIPTMHEGRIVGWIARSIDQGKMRYLSEAPPDFLFNAPALTKPNRKYVVLVEGVFDALAIDGVASLGAKLSPVQAAWLKSSGRQVIVLPDIDKRGRDMIDIAVKHGWSVSFPRVSLGSDNLWDEDIKDAADAVKRYGRLYAIWSIIESMTSHRHKIDMFRKRFF